MAAAKKVKRPRGGASVPCPDCGSHSRVVDTRLNLENQKQVIRIRQCRGRDKHRYTTTEERDDKP